MPVYPILNLDLRLTDMLTKFWGVKRAIEGIQKATQQVFEERARKRETAWQEIQLIAPRLEQLARRQEFTTLDVLLRRYVHLRRMYHQNGGTEYVPTFNYDYDEDSVAIPVL